MEKKEFCIPMTNEELKQWVLRLMEENRTTKTPIDEQSYVLFEVWHAIVGMDRDKKVKDSEVERLMEIYHTIKLGE